MRLEFATKGSVIFKRWPSLQQMSILLTPSQLSPHWLAVQAGWRHTFYIRSITLNSGIMPRLPTLPHPSPTAPQYRGPWSQSTESSAIPSMYSVQFGERRGETEGGQKWTEQRILPFPVALKLGVCRTPVQSDIYSVRIPKNNLSHWAFI